MTKPEARKAERAMPERRGPIGSRTARAAGARRGFTLLEAAMSTVIIGVGVLAVVEAQQSFLERNRWSTNGATATYLADEIREMSERFPRHDRFSGGLYLLDENDPSSLRGWGPEPGENTARDLNDLDDLDGAVFGDAADFPAGFTMTRRYPGPIDSFGRVIPETLYGGGTLLEEGAGGEMVEAPMRGWTQIVEVTKVDPEDITLPVPRNARVMNGAETLRRVDRYPLRVTVRVLWQPDPARPAEVIRSTSWVVMP
jgi:hypothetical protein